MVDTTPAQLLYRVSVVDHVAQQPMQPFDRPLALVTLLIAQQLELSSHASCRGRTHQPANRSPRSQRRTSRHLAQYAPRRSALVSSRPAVQRAVATKIAP